MEKRILFDHQYIREWSIWLDLKIIFKTFSVVFLAKTLIDPLVFRRWCICQFFS